MKVEVKKIDRGRAEVTVELSVDEYQPFLVTAAQQISRNSKIAGFRPGKAGLDVVIKHAGETEVWNQALEPAVNKTLIKAIDDNKLMTVGSPQIGVVKLAPDNPVVYKATVALLPAIKLADYSKIKVSKKPISVTDEQVGAVLANLQLRRAKETAVNRAAQQGDKVEINFEMFLDKIPVEQGQQTNFPLMIGENSFIPGFEDQLIGLKKGETKNFSLTFPANYHQKNLAGKLVDFKVTLSSVFALEKPKLDDDFAKGLGNFSDLAALKKQITENLEHEAKHKEDQRLEEEIFDKLIAGSSFDEIPDILVDSETKKMVQELSQNLAGQGVKFEDYLTHLKKNEQDLLLDFVPQAIKRVKSALVSRAVAQKENVSVSEQDVEEELKKTLTAYGGNPEIEKQLQTPEYKGYLRNILAARKVIDHFKSVMVN